MLQRLWLADLDPRQRRRTPAMRVGLVCPYSWDVPGGVQAHVRDLAEELIRLGPRGLGARARPTTTTPLPPYVVPAGRAVPVPYNGSVARLSFGLLSATPGAALAPRRRLRRAARARAGLAEPVACSPAGPRRADRGDLPRLDRALAGDDRGVRRSCRPRWRRSARRIAVSERARRDAGRAPRRRRGGDPERRRRAPPSRGAEPLPGWPRRRAARSASSAASTSRARACRCCCDALPADRRRAPGRAAAGRRPRRRRRGARGRCPPRCATGSRSSAWSATRTRRAMLRSVDVYVRAQHRRRELRHHPARGDGRRHPGAGQRPRGVPAGCSTRPRRAAVPGRRRRRPGRPGASQLLADPAARADLRAAGDARRRRGTTGRRRRADPGGLRDGDLVAG